MTIAAAALASLALACVLTVLLAAFVYQGRWGTEPAGAVQVGTGPFRGAPVATRRLRGLPGVVGFAAGTGFFWAALTFFGFAPAGALLVLIFAESASAVAALVALASLSGFGIGIALVVASVQLLRRAPNASQLTRSVAYASFVHHAAVVVVMGIASLSEPNLAALLCSTIPCAVGAAHALLLWHAAREVDLSPHD